MDVTLVLTHDCNLGCGYCYAGRKFARAMPRDVATRALDGAFAGAGPRAVGVAYFGGEPLLAWDMLVDVAREARARAAADPDVTLRQTVTTNGTLLDAAKIALLAELDVYVALSFDGTRAAHEVNRPKMGGGSSYDDVARALGWLTAARRPFEVIAVITPASAAHVGESVRELFDGGAPRVTLSPAYEAAWRDEDIAAFDRGLEEVAREMTRHYRAGRVVSVAAIDDKVRARIAGSRGEEGVCPVGDGAVAVAPSGNVYPCERLVGEDAEPEARFVIGHVDRWDAISTLGIRSPEADGHATNEECRGCAERPRCGAACACANLAETGSPWVAGGVQCWHEQATARVADALASAMFLERNETFRRWFFPHGWPLPAADSTPQPTASRVATGAQHAGEIARPRRLPTV